MRQACLAAVFLLFSTEAVFAQRNDLSGVKICIDPGHGGHNPANDRHVIPDAGTDFWESESNFQKALLLKGLLEAKAASVLLTRNTNDYPNDLDEPSLSARVALANANNVQWFHSIHSNASGLSVNTSVNYTLMLVREKRPGGPSSSTGNGLNVPETQEAWDISNIIGPNIRSKLRTQRSTTYLDWTFYGGANGGFSLGVLRGLLMPGQLSEGSFHDYFPETRRLMNNAYRKMEAYAIRDAFLQYYQVPTDTLGTIAGIVSERRTNRLINYVKVRLLPMDSVYTGDRFNNGFYLFDGLPPGTYTIRFETPGFLVDSLQVTLGAHTTVFVDRQIDAVGTTIEAAADMTPSVFALHQNYPNPFNPSTTISFDVPQGVHVTLALYNMLGQRIRILADETRPAGRYAVVVDASTLPSGVYFYRLEAPGYAEVKKMILLR